MKTKLGLTLTLIILISAVITQAARADCYHLMKEPAINHIVLIIDRSGSMNGKPLADAKIGAKAFIDQMNPNDYASVVAFDSKVEVIRGVTNNRLALHRAIDQIRSTGATALYDAIARATLMLAGREGARIVVFLTDGKDTGSRYSISDLEKMNVSEGIFVYGIGLGNVDVDTLRRLSQATNGTFEHTRNSADLKDLYLRVLSEYYQRYGNRLSDTGALTIRSIPDGQEVLLNGRKIGVTPLKMDAATPGDYKVGVIFKRGIWECRAVVKRGCRTGMDARESDLGAELLLVSRPQGATVFLDDTYVGITAIGTPLSLKQKDWAARAKADTRQLRIRKVPYGNHRLRLRGIPDFDFGPEQELEIELPVKDEELILFVDIFRQKVQDAHGNVIAGGKPHDPFRELEEAIESDLDAESDLDNR